MINRHNVASKAKLGLRLAVITLKAIKSMI